MRMPRLEFLIQELAAYRLSKEIAQYLPNERIIYFADTAHVPVARVLDG